MPRTGGVYSPPAGTKGTPNTTIQSVPYNTFVDDLTADANAARPITAGGTGATSASAARTALGLAIGTNVQAYDAGLQSISGLTTVADQMLYTTALDVYATTALTPFARTILDDADAATVRATVGANNASNLTTGTVADARLPTSMAGKTFTSNANFGGGTSVADGDAYLTLNGDRPWVLRQRGEDTTANLSIENNSNKSIGFSCDNTYAGAVIVINPLTSNPYITVLGNTVWHAGNDGAGSGLDADLLDGQDGSFYRNASNINAGTLADARLPTTMSGKIFTGTIHMTGASGGIELGAVGSSNTPTADFHSGAFTTDYDVRLIASGGTAANGAGNLDVICAAFTKGGNTIWHAGNDGPAPAWMQIFSTVKMAPSTPTSSLALGTHRFNRAVAQARGRARSISAGSARPLVFRSTRPTLLRPGRSASAGPQRMRAPLEGSHCLA